MCHSVHTTWVFWEDPWLVTNIVMSFLPMKVGSLLGDISVLILFSRNNCECFSLRVKELCTVGWPLFTDRLVLFTSIGIDNLEGTVKLFFSSGLVVFWRVDDTGLTNCLMLGVHAGETGDTLTVSTGAESELFKPSAFVMQSRPNFSRICLCTYQHRRSVLLSFVAMLWIFLSVWRLEIGQFSSTSSSVTSLPKYFDVHCFLKRLIIFWIPVVLPWIILRSDGMAVKQKQYTVKLYIENESTYILVNIMSFLCERCW